MSDDAVLLERRTRLREVVAREVQAILRHTPGGHPHNQDAHGNDVGAGAVKNLLDKLNLARRAPNGFKVRSSKKLKTDYADVGIAEVDGPDGRQFRVGVITSESGRWDAGFTAESRKAELRKEIARKQELMDSDSEDVDDDIEDQISELESELEDLEGERTVVLTPGQLADFRRQLDEGLGLAKANKAKVEADIKASDAIDEKRDAIIAEHSDAELERKISKASWELRRAQKIVRDLENDLEHGSRHGWSPEFTAERLASWKASVVEHKAELAPLLARRAQIMPPDARARLEDLDRQYAAINDADIDDMLTSAEVSATNGSRIVAEIWGSDDEDEQWVSSRLYVLSPGETTDEIDSEYGTFRGLKGLNKLLQALGELSGGTSDARSSRVSRAHLRAAVAREVQALLLEARHPAKPPHVQSSHGRKGAKAAVKAVAKKVIADAAPKASKSPATGTDALPRQNRRMTLRQAAQGTNPNFGTTDDNPTYRDAGRAGQRWTSGMGPLPSGAYEQNCTNCVQAFEMRMRGYDVQAAPLNVLDKHGYAMGRTFGETDEMISASWRLADGSPHGRSFSGQPWRSFEQIDAEVATWPEGGRGVITTGRHIFSVVNVRGKAQYIESQYDASPTRVVTTLYKRKFRAYLPSGGQRQEGKLIRLDDLEPVDAIRETVEAVQ